MRITFIREGFEENRREKMPNVTEGGLMTKAIRLVKTEFVTNESRRSKVLFLFKSMKKVEDRS